MKIKDTVLDERVRAIVGVPLELPVASTAEGDFVRPFGEVEEVELVFPDKTLSSGSLNKGKKCSGS